MLSSKRVFVIASALLLLGSLAAAQKKRRTVDVVPNPPSVNLTGDAATVTVCPREEANGGARVQLTANATSPDGLPLRYTWKTTGGRIVGDGANTVWDLSSTTPGSYVASVEVTSGDARCTAFATIPVAVVECPPLREVCPNISITCPDSVRVGTPLTFSADVNGGTPGAQAAYNWTVSAGTITSGQGTPSITVSTAGLGGQDVRATLTVNGYSGLNCTAACSTPVQVERIKPRKFDEIGNIAHDDEKARLDIFAAELQNDPRSTGYIVATGGKPGEAQKRLNDEKTYLVNTRGMDASRIVTLAGRTGGDIRIEFWLVPPGAEAPTPQQ
jgi:hypothetical protein